MISTVSFTEIVQIFLVGWATGCATVFFAAWLLARRSKKEK